MRIFAGVFKYDICIGKEESKRIKKEKNKIIFKIGRIQISNKYEPMKLVFHTYILCFSLKTITFVAPNYIS